MNSCYDFWKDIIIPLFSAIIGGGITLLGVVLTIKSENKKTKQQYIESIRPFLVVETPKLIELQRREIKPVRIFDDSSEDAVEGAILFHWDSLILSNVSENVCLIDYVKINKKKYSSFFKNPIKSGEYCEILGYPLSLYISNSPLNEIVLGVLDRQFHHYEYKVAYEIDECQVNEDKYIHKKLHFTAIDCRTNMHCSNMKGNSNGHHRTPL